MIRVIFSVLLACVTIGLSSCSKQQARKTLVGMWSVEYYDVRVSDPCLDDSGPFVGASRSYGNAVFEKDQFTLNFKLDDDNSSVCIPEFNFSGDWKVTGHEREFLIEHAYKVELDGNEWDLIFEDQERSHVKANQEQDIISLSTSFSNGDMVYLQLIRESK